MNCSKCGTGNPEGENFCMQCGASLKLPSSGVPQNQAPSAINPGATIPAGSSKTKFIIIAAVACILLIVAIALLLSGPLIPDIPIDQAIAEGYPVICEVRGVVDGMPRNYNVYIQSPRYSAELSETNQLFAFFDGSTNYHYTFYSDAPEWFADHDPFFIETPLEFLQGYRDMEGSMGERASVECRIVEYIPNEKFTAPLNIGYSSEGMLCDVFLGSGESFHDDLSGITFEGKGAEYYNGKQMCRIDAFGGEADLCGGFRAYMDIAAFVELGEMLDADADFDMDILDFFACETGTGSEHCFNLCMQYLLDF
jgi:hypothetical protein